MVDSARRTKFALARALESMVESAAMAWARFVLRDTETLAAIPLSELARAVEVLAVASEAAEVDALVAVLAVADSAATTTPENCDAIEAI